MSDAISKGRRGRRPLQAQWNKNKIRLTPTLRDVIMRFFIYNHLYTMDKRFITQKSEEP